MTLEEFAKAHKFNMGALHCLESGDDSHIRSYAAKINELMALAHSARDFLAYEHPGNRANLVADIKKVFGDDN